MSAESESCGLYGGNIMTDIALIFGCAWLAAGLYEMRTALTHAKRYEVKPWLWAAWYWLAISAGAFGVVYTGAVK